MQSESVAGYRLDGYAGGVNHAAAFGNCALAPGQCTLTDSDLCTVAVNCGNVAKKADIVQGHFGFHGSFRGLPCGGLCLCLNPFRGAVNLFFQSVTI
jgi:hypothetical protein